MKHSKRYRALAEKRDPSRVYSLAEALALLKESPTKFDAGVELHVKLGIDPTKSEQTVRGTVALPHGTGKSKRVAAFVSPAHEQEARDAGADILGTEDVIAEIQKTGKCDFDVAVATPDMMRKLGPIAKILGQQGLMPNPKTETVGTDVKKMVQELKTGKVAFRSDKGGNAHFIVGRLSFDAQQLEENINQVMKALQRAKPDEAKGTYFQNVTLTASMSPGIRVAVS